MKEQTQSQTASTSPVSIPAIPVKQTDPLIVVAILVFLLMGGGLIYFEYQNYQLLQKLNQLLEQQVSQSQSLLPEVLSSPTSETITGWRQQKVESIGLDFLAPAEIITTISQPTTSHITITLAKKMPPGEYYQLYMIYQWDPPYNVSELENLKKDLEPSSVTEVEISGYQGIRGQVAGERNRYVTHFIRKNGLFSAYTADPTKENEQLSNQILSTFKFSE